MVSEQTAFSSNLEPVTQRLVVLAEEDEDVREALAASLRQDGYSVIEVEDGLELRDYLEVAYEDESHGLRPDVIVCQNEMSGMSGLDLLQYVRSQDPALGFVLINSSGDLDLYDEAEARGADFVLSRPIDLDELRGALQVLGYQWATQIHSTWPSGS